MSTRNHQPQSEHFTGHGAEWRAANLSSEQAQLATAWVEQKIDRRSMLTNQDRVEDVRDAMWQLETIDENLFDVIVDFMDEKREDWKDWLADQEDEDDD